MCCDESLYENNKINEAKIEKRIIFCTRKSSAGCACCDFLLTTRILPLFLSQLQNNVNEQTFLATKLIEKLGIS